MSKRTLFRYPGRLLAIIAATVTGYVVIGAGMLALMGAW